jgi:anti-sigma regulatory factor (Ser/Thr protein kinase)
MQHAFERTLLWQALAARIDDPHAAQREVLRTAYLQFRETVKPFANEIAMSMPIFTDHSIAHIDALWDTASMICGEHVPVNPAEAFVLGGAFLMHDLGMGLVAYPLGAATLESDPEYPDLLAGHQARLAAVSPSTPQAELAREQTIVELLRRRHASQAERLISSQFQGPDGDHLYLLQDLALRHRFGALIGRIAASHWWDVDNLRCFEQKQGSSPDHPAEWDVDPLKLACILRLADAAQIDERRAPVYLRVFRNVSGVSEQHWRFQERLTRPLVVGDRLEYTATRPFRRGDVDAWWLAYEMVKGVDDELRKVDALCADLRRDRFAVRSVAGADSPERLAAYLRTDGWRPVDATLRVSDVNRLVATLGGHDLYGNRPDVALRELIANAADAMRARAIVEDRPAGTVTVRLSEDQGQWWLEVEDTGVGMDSATMVRALTDFGFSRWRSDSAIRQYPGLLSKGFQPIGRFGIGFFAVFMVADDVQVTSLSHEDAPRSTHVLEFSGGLSSRPLLREADQSERLRRPGTRVRARLLEDPRSETGLFRTSSRRLRPTQLFHALVRRTCALLDVNVEVQGPEDPQPQRVVTANDWTSIPAVELFTRIYPREEADYYGRRHYDAFESLFVERARDVLDDEGRVVGRAMIASGWEPVDEEVRRWLQPQAQVYVGGLLAGTMEWCMGAFAGMPLTADRLKAFPSASPPALRRWVEGQAEVARRNPIGDRGHLAFTGTVARGLGAEALSLPCADTLDGPLDAADLAKWLAERDEILIVNPLFHIFDQGTGTRRFFSFGGTEVRLDDRCLVTNLYSLWLYPEEVLPHPLVESLADAVEPEDGAWHAPSWWYDNGAFGSIALVMRAIRTSWGMTLEQVLEGMVPLYAEPGNDRRPELPTVEGGTLRMNMIRLRRRSPGAQE